MKAFEGFKICFEFMYDFLYVSYEFEVAAWCKLLWVGQDWLGYVGIGRKRFVFMCFQELKHTINLFVNNRCN